MLGAATPAPDVCIARCGTWPTASMTDEACCGPKRGERSLAAGADPSPAKSLRDVVPVVSRREPTHSDYRDHDDLRHCYCSLMLQPAPASRHEV
jgi:hypothetical protein